MKNRKILVSSMIMIISCCLLFAGTTFAWFSDSVTSNNNIITAGNLDVELEYSYDAKDWKTVDADTYVFNQEALWEPGYTEYVFLRVSNKGSLSLKYTLALRTAEQVGTNVNGEEYKLSDYLTVSAVISDVIEPGKLSRKGAEAILANGTNEVGFGVLSKSAALLKGEADYVQLVIGMPSSVGNEANPQKGKEAKISFALDLIATQLNNEQDSFGSDYDEAAPWVGGVNTDWYFEDPTAANYTLNSAEDLAGLAAIVNGTASSPLARSAVNDNFKGKTITLTSDLDLQGIEWSPIGTDENPFLGNFDGAGHTIYNLNVNNDGWAGFIGHAGKGNAVTISNLTIDGATITSNRMAGVVVGQVYGNVINCHVKNAEIIVTPNWVEKDQSYDNGDKVGGVVGWLGDNGNKHTLANCTATNVYIKGYRDLGGIAGYVASSTTIKENSVNGITIYGDQITNSYGKKDLNLGAICGRKNGTVTELDNAYENLSITGDYIDNGIQYYAINSDPENPKIYLYDITEEFVGDTIVVPNGVTHLRNKLLQDDTQIKEVVIPLSVVDFGGKPNANNNGASGGFFYKSSVEKVTLPEGLTEIPVAAFNQASKLKEVNIPSTVKSLGIGAFQNAGLTNITISANIESLGYGTFRDMKNLTTIIFEGNLEIPGYALRACTNLRTVVFEGDDVTFAGRGMIITNKENGDGSAVTVYVANETVKERLIASDTASKDHGGYKIIVGSKAVSTASDLIAELNNGSAVRLSNSISTPATVKAPYGNYAGLIQKGGLLDGMGETLSVTGGGDTYAIMTYGGTIKNLVIDYGFRGIVLYSPTEDVIIDNVYVAGKVGYTINTAEYPTVSGIDLIVSNSTFGGWMSFAGIESASFTNCKFIYGSYYNTWPYDSVFKPMVNTTLTNCDFAQEYYLDLSDLGAGCTIKLANCTVNGVKITADNFVQLFGEVELPSGRTISDCIIFA